MKQVIQNFFIIMLFVIQMVLISTNLSCSKSAPGKIALNRPESVAFDAKRDRYLISNVAGKNILAMDKNNKLTSFAADLTGPKGLTIRGDELYVADVNSVRGFDLKTGAQTWFLPLPKAEFLNDTAVDDTHYLYVSDSEANCIYRIDLDDRTFEIFHHDALSKPNGLYYNSDDKKLLIVSQRHKSPIQSLDWKSRNLETLMNTSLSGLDGLTRDKAGNYYITSWLSGGVYKINSDFKLEPALMKKGFKGPADIGYNPVKNTLLLPIMMENRTEVLGIW